MRLSTDQRKWTGVQTARSYGGADHRERREAIMRSREISEADDADTVVIAEEQPGEAERYQVVPGGEHCRLVRDRQEEGE